MAKVILHIATSLDGFIAGPNDELDWLPQEPDAIPGFSMEGFMQSCDTVLIGKNTWRVVKGFEEEPFADYKRHILGYSDDESRQTLLNLDRSSDKDIWLLGGGYLNALCHELGVIDQIHIMTIPVEIGQGLPLFGPLGVEVPEGWTIKEEHQYEGGFVERVYVQA